MQYDMISCIKPLFFVIVLSIISTGCLFDVNEPSVRIDWASDNIIVVRDRHEFELSKDSAIEQGDSVLVPPKNIVKISFPCGSTMVLGQESVCKIASLGKPIKLILGDEGSLVAEFMDSAIISIATNDDEFGNIRVKTKNKSTLLISWFNSSFVRICNYSGTISLQYKENEKQREKLISPRTTLFYWRNCQIEVENKVDSDIVEYLEMNKAP